MSKALRAGNGVQMPKSIDALFDVRTMTAVFDIARNGLRAIAERSVGQICSAAKG
jgi:hypothetical protein